MQDFDQGQQQNIEIPSNVDRGNAELDDLHSMNVARDSTRVGWGWVTRSDVEDRYNDMGKHSTDDTDIYSHSGPLTNLKKSKEEEQDAELGKYHRDAVEHVHGLCDSNYLAFLFKEIIKAEIPRMKTKAKASLKDPSIQSETCQGYRSSHHAEYIFPSELRFCIGEFSTQSRQNKK